MDIIKLKHITKQYDDGFVALKDINLTIESGKFYSLLGPSGSGKSTILRIIAGFTQPTDGKVYFDGKDITNLDAAKRHINTVFQNYALFPHMTVEKNITYVPVISGSRDRKANHQLALKLLRQVGLEEEMASRYPSQLSGGQQQRVGIARALAAKPHILLMDEPFGALDEITRQGMQDELLKLKTDLGLTIVFVTHDIREAMKLGDRILVMDKGSTVQLDTPVRIKDEPANDFVRGLLQAVGSPILE